MPAQEPGPAGAAAGGAVPRECGRPRDASRDTAIEAAALDLLVEVGYDRLTMEAVAARARAGKATVYRRWASKAELVVDALTHLEARSVPCPTAESDDLRTALLGLSCQTLGMADPRRVRLVAAMATALVTDPQIGAIWRERLLQPRLAELRRCFDAAEQRGELAPGADVEAALTALPALVLFHVLFTDDPVDEAFVARVLDGVVLPAVTRATQQPRPVRQEPGRGQRPTTEGTPARVN